MPLLSIVIANYNYGRFLEAAIQSVVAQLGVGKDRVNPDEVELIIIDGGSTDNSVEIIQKYAERISWWVSEKDNGQSDAFNKGFSRARGKYLTWLNADDVLVPGALAKVIRAFKQHPDTEWFTANTIRFLNDGSVYQIWWGPHWYPKMLQKKNSPIVTFGPSTFFARDLYSRVGKIDESFHYMMDTDLWVRFMQAGVKQYRINCFFWGFRLHDISKTAEFGEHSVSPKVAQAMKLEGKLFDKKNRYRMSRIMRFACLAFRIIDGSLIRKMWYDLTMKTFKEGTV